MRYVCCDERRLTAVKEAGLLNGIEYVEVSDSEAPTPPLRQRTLFVRLFMPAPGLGVSNLTITGGERVPTVAIEWVAPASALPAGEDPALIAGIDDPANVLLVRTASRGDFSTYTLKLVAGPGSASADPPAGFDPLLATVEFSFKVECPSDFDCAAADECPPDSLVPLSIDCLAKDYESFRSLMLDRMSLLAPGWTERSPADVGVALVEVLAYVADELSYRQDAVATEAYIGTARLRTSLRRLARLVDYVVHDGCNARAWVCVRVGKAGVSLPAGTPLLTSVPGLPDIMEPGDEHYRAALAAGAETFETVGSTVLYDTHERLDFWTWGDDACCLPRGATSATLVGHHPQLKTGDILVFVEVASPTTGKKEDVDPAKKAAVRLTHVVSSEDPSGGLFSTPPTNNAVDVTEISWDEADALPLPVCVSVAERPGLVVSQALGNVVLADHGRTISGESLGEVPEPQLTYASGGGKQCETAPDLPVPARFRPRLSAGPVTNVRPLAEAVAEGVSTPALVADLTALNFSPALHDWLEERRFVFTAGPPVVRGGDGMWSVSDGVTVAVLVVTAGTIEVYERPRSACATTSPDPASASPALEATGTLLGSSDDWHPQVDLLASDGDAPELVVETEHDGTATLRFGDGVHGRRVEAGTTFVATYRVGNGTAGNVGAESIAHVVTLDGDVLGATNPLPATGGTNPETAEEVRRDAPEAYLVQERAVTADDYARMTERNSLVQRAAATFRWTGSWHTVFVTADRTGGRALDQRFESDIRRHLEPFRMAGYDLEVDGPQFVPLEVGLHVCVAGGYFASHVKAAVLEVLSSGTRADGTLGYFHPDRFTFGTTVYFSPIVAAAQAVAGVESVSVYTFQRQRDVTTTGLDAGELPMGRLEIPRLDNDPSFPERGVLVLTMGGGR